MGAGIASCLAEATYTPASFMSNESRPAIVEGDCAGWAYNL